MAELAKQEVGHNWKKRGQGKTTAELKALRNGMCAGCLFGVAVAEGLGPGDFFFFGVCREKSDLGTVNPVSTASCNIFFKDDTHAILLNWHPDEGAKKRLIEKVWAFWASNSLQTTSTDTLLFQIILDVSEMLCSFIHLSVWELSVTYVCYGLWSKPPIVSKNNTEVDGHEANSRGLYTDCKGSLLMVGRPSSVQGVLMFYMFV